MSGASTISLVQVSEGNPKHYKNLKNASMFVVAAIDGDVNVEALDAAGTTKLYALTSTDGTAGVVYLSNVGLNEVRVSHPGGGSAVALVGELVRM
jgi:hypothetical protein